uniref:GPI mannosyltransferase 2 n=1 Tax=Callorhinchus milii TaxID=7868 RepID=A0A4W3JS18_CALMI|eukprot:gi/632954741/ref/XP_007893122.1/ PREDICTED: GPI mannosyltransferase 2 [Callorhinchus milii]
MEVYGIRSVMLFALYTRILTVLLQVLFNSLIPDHTADAFSPPQLHNSTLGDVIVQTLLSGFSHWDAQHFLFIAEFGYVFEHNFAFLPLFPGCMRIVAETLASPCKGCLSLHNRLLLSGVLLNTVLFTLAAGALYKLSCVVLKDHSMATLASLLFCLTPVSVFMSAAYSESMFILLALAGMWQLEIGWSVLGCVFFALATATRSNGTVNAGFLIYLELKRSVRHVRAVMKSAVNGPQTWCWLRVAAQSVLTVAGGTIAIVLPFALFQYYGYLTFCTPTVTSGQDVPQPLLQLAREKGYRVPDINMALPSWCSHRFPLIYSYIQKVYWNLGFLKYYQLRQLPNFLLALPAAFLGGWAAWQYVAADFWYCVRLGLVSKRRTEVGEKKPANGFHSPEVFIYLVHMAGLLAFAVCFMHIQVLTRFLASSSPVLYWFCAHLIQKAEAEHATWNSVAAPTNPVLPKNILTELLLDWRQRSPTTRWLLAYFLLYWLLGLLLHCNFLPWT